MHLAISGQAPSFASAELRKGEGDARFVELACLLLGEPLAWDLHMVVRVKSKQIARYLSVSLLSYLCILLEVEQMCACKVEVGCYFTFHVMLLYRSSYMMENI